MISPHPFPSPPAEVERHVCGWVAYVDPVEQRGFLVTRQSEQFPFDRAAIREDGIALLRGERVIAKIQGGRAVAVRRSVLG
jgi:hypothetical protein